MMKPEAQPAARDLSATALLVAMFLALTLAGATGVTAQTDCSAPEAPSMPDGATATMDEMLAGQSAVKAFQADNMEYMKCLEAAWEAAEKTAKKADEKAAREAAEARYEDAVEAYNAAVSAEEEVAGAFNVALREYRAANK